MITVDSHTHINFSGFSLGDIIKYLDKNRIDYCWLLSWEEIAPGPWPYQHLSVEALYEAYLKYPSRIVPFYAPDPHRDDAVAQLEYWYRKGLRGCGEMKATVNWDSDNVRKILSKLEELKMPLLFHMEESGRRVGPRSSGIFNRTLYRCLDSTSKLYRIPQRVLRLLTKICPPIRNRLEYYTFPGYMLDFASLEIALADYPGVNFIAHGPMFWKHISADADTSTETYPRGPIMREGIIWRLLRDYPNLYVDTSAASGLNALTRDPANIKEFISLFEDKILYGTDNLMKGQRNFLDSLKLSRETYEKIYGGNASRLINR